MLKLLKKTKNFDSMMVYFGARKSYFYIKFNLSFACNLLIFVNTGAEIAELCSPWILVVNSLLSRVSFSNLLQNSIPNSYSSLHLLVPKETVPYFLPPNFEFLASVCLHFSIF